MSEAEKKWVDWDQDNGNEAFYKWIASKNSREAFKAALRREIEEMKEERASPQWTTAIDNILELLDTVEP